MCELRQVEVARTKVRGALFTKQHSTAAYLFGHETQEPALPPPQPVRKVPGPQLPQFEHWLLLVPTLYLLGIKGENGSWRK